MRAALPSALLLAFAAPCLLAQTPRAVVTKSPQAGVLHFTNGQRWSGTIHSLDGKEVRFFRQGQKYDKPLAYKSNTITSVTLANDVLTYDAARGEFVSNNERTALALKAVMDREAARSGRVKVVNRTNRTVTLFVTGARDRLGRDVRIPLVKQDDGPKSNLEEGLAAFARAFGGGRDAKESGGPPQWEIGPRQTTSLKLQNGEWLHTSQLEYTLQAKYGTRNHALEFDRKTNDFEVILDERNMPPPVLVTFGTWTVHQDAVFETGTRVIPERRVSNSTMGKRTMTTVTTTSPAREEEYTRKRVAGVASARCSVENPTDKALDVEVLLEFRFTALLMSAERVKAEFSIPPRSTRTVVAQVETRGLWNNREATGVRVVDVKTTPR